MSTGRKLAMLAAGARPARRRELVILLTALFLSAIADSAAILSLAHFLSAISTSASTTSFWAFIAAILVASGLRFAVSFGMQHFGHFAARDLMVDLQARILSLPYERHFHRHSADLLALPEKIEQLIFGLVIPLLQAFAAIITTAFVFATLGWIGAGSAILALLLVAVLYGGIAVLVRQRIARAGQVIAAAYSDRIRITQEGVGGLRDLIIDGTRPAHLSRFDRVATRQSEAGIISSVLASVPRHAAEALGIAAIAALVLVTRGGNEPMLSALPTIGALALAGQRLLPMAQALYQGWSSAIAGRPLLDEVCETLSLPLPASQATPASDVPFEHSIELRRVSYSYPGREQPALDDVDLTVLKGEYVAIAGETGAGKSTLADVIMGLLPVSSGHLLIDGQDIRSSSAEGWQRHIAHVPQAPFLSDDSLARNIALVADDKINPEWLQRSIELAGLAHVIQGLSDGAATNIGEHGARLSGGQRQRVALARAIYRQPSLLILDEATSALDDVTEADIRKALLTLRQDGTTIIVITHRGGLLDDADRVVVLKQGRVAAPIAAQATR